MSKKKRFLKSDEKLAKAKKIAEKAPKIQRSYATIENILIYIYRGMTSLFYKIFTNKTVSKIFSLILAVILYVAVNAASTNMTGISQSATLNEIPVNVICNYEIYEVSGIPDQVSVIVQGDMSDITLQKSATNALVTADLSGLIEGTYTIKLTPTNFNNKLAVNILDTPSVNVTIKKKVTTKYNISYDFVNTNKMDSRYALDAPVFDTTEVLIRASQDTIDSIACVKALIDVEGVTGPFTRNANIVCYDNHGNIVECDIIPSTVVANVNVTSPSKEVPIIVRPTGNLLEGYAIDSIILDYSTTTIYAPVSVLNMIDAVYLDVDVSSITKNTKLATDVKTPSGVTSISVTKVNMEIVIGEKTSKTIENVLVTYTNLDPKYKFKVVNTDEATLNVVVYGTENNLANLTADDFQLVMDLADVTVGMQQAPLTLTCDNDYITCMIANNKKYIDIEVTE